MTHETVSIIMATQNRAKLLPRALDSIAAQTYKDYTLYVMNDASSDETSEVLERYTKIIPSMVVERNPTALGYRRSLVKLITRSHGKYIARIDDDDVWLPEKLEKQIRFLEDNPDISLIGTATQGISSSGTLLTTTINPPSDKDIREKLLQVNQFAHSSIVVRREVYDQVGGYNSDFTVEDYELWLRLGAHGAKLANLEEVLTYIGLTEGQISTKKRRKFILSEMRAIWKYRKFYKGFTRAIIKRMGAVVLPQKISARIGGFLRKYTSF